jgi:polyferredoxin
MANAFFWSRLFLIGKRMAGIVVHFMIKYPTRRMRLLILSVCHFSVILFLPMVLNNWSWTCLLYPWPHSLQAFDPATPRLAFYLSVLIGFILVPLITYRWGAKGFCGYLCPHGAFFSETYGRVFDSHQERLHWLRHFVPQTYFALMAVALLLAIVLPSSILQIRSIQKLVYFFTAEFFYFAVGIPLLGGRSYCRLVCPMGYFVGSLVRYKIKNKRKTVLPST